jgi:hypothetical protein
LFSSLLCVPLINRCAVPVSAKYKTNDFEQHQDGSGYHQQMLMLHRGKHGVRLQSAQKNGPSGGTG